MSRAVCALPKAEVRTSAGLGSVPDEAWDFHLGPRRERNRVSISGVVPVVRGRSGKATRGVFVLREHILPQKLAFSKGLVEFGEQHLGDRGAVRGDEETEGLDTPNAARK